VTGCSFQQNQAYYGGAINANNYTSGTFEKSQFVGNWSVNGGAISFAGFSSTLVNRCLFLGNECRQISYYQQSFNGGAINNWCAGTTFVNCIFNKNWANGAGGAFYDAGPSSTSGSLINCTFVNNTCRDGGVVAAADGHNPQVKNALFWNNVVTTTMGTVTVSGVNTISSSLYNPSFMDVDGADNIVGTQDDDLRLASYSLALDAGNNAFLPSGITTDYAGNSRTIDADQNGTAITDLGAIEFVPPLCSGDADGNRAVNFADITSVLANFNSSGPAGDADHSGAVNFADITSVLANWGIPCP
jgi:predicted outer membrane repeat protein